MDRSREARRASMASTNGLSRRRQRSSSLRDSPEEDGQMELQETVRLRERANKKNRDRDSLNRNKRRRGDRYAQGSNREEGEESTEESVDDEEEEEEEEDGGVPRMIPPNTRTSSSHNHRRSFPPAKLARQAPTWKVTDEMIGVAVPRKARSASVKRSHEYWISGGGGVGEEPKSIDTVLPWKKMKPIGPKKRPPKVSKPSSLIQEDIEIEVAEVLYGLMKQSQCSKKQETTENSSPKLESKDINDPKRKKSQPPVVNEEGNGGNIVVQKGSISSPKLEKISEFDLGTSQAGAVSLEDSKPPMQESGSGDRVVTKEESPSCTKLDDELENSSAIKAISTAGDGDVGRKREEMLKIDLMAFPPMLSSPERNDFTKLISDPKLMSQDVEMKKTGTVVEDGEEMAEQLVKKAVIEGLEGKKVEAIGVKHELPKLRVDKQDHDNNGSVSSSNRLQQHGLKQQQQQPNATVLKGEKTAQSSSLPLSIAVAGWPGGLSPLGYMPPLPTVVSMETSSGSSAAVQPPHFLPSQPRPKRCVTHQYIARNICYLQQFSRMNHFWPAAASSASLHGTKPYNVNVMPSVENMILGSPLQGSFPGGNLNSMPDRGQAAVATFPGHSGKEKSSEAANLVDTAQRKKLVLQQAPQPVPAGNIMHGPAFIFPLSHHQAAVAATANQSGLPKFVNSTTNAPSSGNLAAGALVGSSSLPAVATAVSFNYPSLPANEAPPYLALLQNNGCPFPISTHVGTPPAFRGGTHAQAMHFFNGSFYSTQMFHPSQLQQQQPHSRPLVQPAHQNTSTSSGSSSSHKQPQPQQQLGGQVSGNNLLTSTNMQLQQPQKQHVPPSHSSRKLEAEMSGEDTASAADSRAFRSQKSVYGQNFAVPVQPMNFALMSSATLGGSGSGNHGEQQPQQSQQKGLKGGVDLIPSQQFALSFASFNASGGASGLNFSSVAQNPAFFQSLPELARHGYQSAPAAQAAQQKNYQISEGKSGGDSTNPNNGRIGILGKSPGSAGQSLAFSKPGSADPSASTMMGTAVFDSSARTLNFVSSPVTGNRPSRSTSTAMTTASGTVNPQNSQQQQLIQLQKQHMMQQVTGAARTKAPTTNSMPSSSIATKFPNNTSVLSQSPQWKHSTRAPVSQVPSPSVAASTPSTLKNRAPQGHTQISFGGNPKSATAPQGQQIPISSQSPSPLVAGSPPNSSVSKSASGGSMRTASTGSKAGPSIPALQSQQAENSSTGPPSQKSSPVCGRNVPSILSTCPSHLSELKY